jgi:tRNA A-37 threonylcarbamoyl transferase component Bud32
MGNKWSHTAVSSDIVIEEDEPPDPPEEDGIAITLLETCNFSFSQLESNGAKPHTLIRVSSTFNTRVYNKPVKYTVKDGNIEWNLPKRRFFFASANPAGNVKVCLLHTTLPPLPAVPNRNELCSSQEKKISKSVAYDYIEIPISLEEFKTSKRVERWLKVESQENYETYRQVHVAIEFYYRPSRVLKAGETINDKYEIENVLGSGQSVVKKAKNKHNNKEYAIKFLSKQHLKGQNISKSGIDKEIELMRSLTDPNIVQMFESLESNDMVYLVMELVKGSDVCDVVSTLGSIRPAVAGAFIGQVLSAVAYLHSRGITHHDIKMENVLVDYFSNQAKLTDFGSAKDVKNMSGVGGTINYMAPELLLNLRGGRQQKCDQSIDIWSIGVVAYIMLCGTHPFAPKAQGNQNIINRIISGKFNFPSPQWDNIPKHCKDFIRRCLVLDPKARPSAAELLKHPWITSSAENISENTFTKQETERLEHERSSRNSSRSNSMKSLLELFGQSNATCLVRS